MFRTTFHDRKEPHKLVLLAHETGKREDDPSVLVVPFGVLRPVAVVVADGVSFSARALLQVFSRRSLSLLRLCCSCCRAEGLALPRHYFSLALSQLRVLWSAICSSMQLLPLPDNQA